MRFPSGPLALAWAALAIAAALPANAQPSRTDADELGTLFDQVCLRAFPDDAALDRDATHRHAAALTRARVQDYLHDDPGRGWSYTTALASYIITIEQPPFHACAIRRMTPSGLPGTDRFTAAVNGYVTSRHAALTSMPRQAMTTADGAALTASGQSINRADGSVAETFLVIITDYHDRGVEVRYVHQIPSPGLR